MRAVRAASGAASGLVVANERVGERLWALHHKEDVPAMEEHKEGEHSDHHHCSDDGHDDGGKSDMKKSTKKKKSSKKNESDDESSSSSSSFSTGKGASSHKHHHHHHDHDHNGDDDGALAAGEEEVVVSWWDDGGDAEDNNSLEAGSLEGVAVSATNNAVEEIGHKAASDGEKKALGEGGGLSEEGFREESARVSDHAPVYDKFLVETSLKDDQKVEEKIVDQEGHDAAGKGGAGETVIPHEPVEGFGKRGMTFAAVVEGGGGRADVTTSFENTASGDQALEESVVSEYEGSGSAHNEEETVSASEAKEETVVSRGREEESVEDVKDEESTNSGQSFLTEERQAASLGDLAGGNEQKEIAVGAELLEGESEGHAETSTTEETDEDHGETEKERGEVEAYGMSAEGGGDIQASDGLTNQLEPEKSYELEDRMNGGLNDQLEGKSGLNDQLEGSRSSGFNDQVEGSRSGFSDQVEGRSSGLNDQLEGSRSGFNDQLEGRSSGLNDQLEGEDGGGKEQQWVHSYRDSSVEFGSPLEHQRRLVKHQVATPSPPKRENSVYKIVMALEGLQVGEKCIHGEIDHGVCHQRYGDRRMSSSPSFGGRAYGETSTPPNDGDNEGGASATEVRIGGGEKKEVDSDWSFVQHDSQSGTTTKQTVTIKTETYTDTVVFRRDDGFLGKSPLSGSQSMRAVFNQADAFGSTSPPVKIVHEFPPVSLSNGSESHHDGVSTSSTLRVEGESEVERILRLQETHDLVCPVCRSCITKRVVLRKRKRTTVISTDRWETEVRHDEEDENIQEQALVDTTRELGDGDTVVEQYEDYGCLACFTFLFRRDRSVQRTQGVEVSGAAERAANLSSSVESASQTTDQSAVFRLPEPVAVPRPALTDADYDNRCLPIFFTWKRKTIIPAVSAEVVAPLLSKEETETLLEESSVEALRRRSRDVLRVEGLETSETSAAASVGASDIQQSTGFQKIQPPVITESNIQNSTGAQKIQPPTADPDNILELPAAPGVVEGVQLPVVVVESREDRLCFPFLWRRAASTTTRAQSELVQPLLGKEAVERQRGVAGQQSTQIDQERDTEKKSVDVEQRSKESRQQSTQIDQERDTEKKSVDVAQQSKESRQQSSDEVRQRSEDVESQTEDISRIQDDLWLGGEALDVSGPVPPQEEPTTPGSSGTPADQPDASFKTIRVTEEERRVDCLCFPSWNSSETKSEEITESSRITNSSASGTEVAEYIQTYSVTSSESTGNIQTSSIVKEVVVPAGSASEASEIITSAALKEALSSVTSGTEGAEVISTPPSSKGAVLPVSSVAKDREAQKASLNCMDILIPWGSKGAGTENIQTSSTVTEVVVPAPSASEASDIISSAALKEGSVSSVNSATEGAEIISNSSLPKGAVLPVASVANDGEAQKASLNCMDILIPSYPWGSKGTGTENIQTSLTVKEVVVPAASASESSGIITSAALKEALSSVTSGTEGSEVISTSSASKGAVSSVTENREAQKASLNCMDILIPWGSKGTGTKNIQTSSISKEVVVPAGSASEASKIISSSTVRESVSSVTSGAEGAEVISTSHSSKGAVLPVSTVSTVSSVSSMTSGSEGAEVISTSLASKGAVSSVTEDRETQKASLNCMDILIPWGSKGTGTENIQTSSVSKEVVVPAGSASEASKIISSTSVRESVSSATSGTEGAEITSTSPLLEGAVIPVSTVSSVTTVSSVAEDREAQKAILNCMDILIPSYPWGPPGTGSRKEVLGRVEGTSGSDTSTQFKISAGGQGVNTGVILSEQGAPDSLSKESQGVTAVSQISKGSGLSENEISTGRAEDSRCLPLLLPSISWRRRELATKDNLQSSSETKTAETTSSLTSEKQSSVASERNSLGGLESQTSSGTAQANISRGKEAGKELKFGDIEVPRNQKQQIDQNYNDISAEAVDEDQEVPLVRRPPASKHLTPSEVEPLPAGEDQRVSMDTDESGMSEVFDRDISFSQESTPSKVQQTGKREPVKTGKSGISDELDRDRLSSSQELTSSKVQPSPAEVGQQASVKTSKSGISEELDKNISSSKELTPSKVEPMRGEWDQQGSVKTGKNFGSSEEVDRDRFSSSQQLTAETGQRVSAKTGKLSGSSEVFDRDISSSQESTPSKVQPLPAEAGQQGSVKTGKNFGSSEELDRDRFSSSQELTAEAGQRVSVKTGKVSGSSEAFDRDISSSEDLTSSKVQPLPGEAGQRASVKTGKSGISEELDRDRFSSSQELTTSKVQPSPAEAGQRVSVKTGKVSGSSEVFDRDISSSQDLTSSKVQPLPAETGQGVSVQTGKSGISEVVDRDISVSQDSTRTPNLPGVLPVDETFEEESREKGSWNCCLPSQSQLASSQSSVSQDVTNASNLQTVSAGDETHEAERRETASWSCCLPSYSQLADQPIEGGVRGEQTAPASSGGLDLAAGADSQFSGESKSEVTWETTIDARLTTKTSTTKPHIETTKGETIDGVRIDTSVSYIHGSVQHDKGAVEGKIHLGDHPTLSLQPAGKLQPPLDSTGSAAIARFLEDDQGAEGGDIEDAAVNEWLADSSRKEVESLRGVPEVEQVLDANSSVLSSSYVEDAGVEIKFSGAGTMVKSPLVLSDYQAGSVQRTEVQNLQGSSDLVEEDRSSCLPNSKWFWSRPRFIISEEAHLREPLLGKEGKAQAQGSEDLLLQSSSVQVDSKDSSRVTAQQIQENTGTTGARVREEEKCNCLPWSSSRRDSNLETSQLRQEGPLLGRETGAAQLPPSSLLRSVSEVETRSDSSSHVTLQQKREVTHTTTSERATSEGQARVEEKCNCLPWSIRYNRDLEEIDTTVTVTTDDTVIEVVGSDASSTLAAARVAAQDAGMIDGGLIQEPEYLKSIVYGGLDVTFTSLGVVASAAGGDATTRNVLSLGLANVLFGFIAFYYKIQDLHRDSPARFQGSVGPRFWVNGPISLISFLFFGVLPVLTFGFTFRELNDHDYKMAATVLVSIVAIIFLGCGKVAAKATELSYRRTLSTLIFTGLVAAVAGFYSGEYISKLLEKYGILDDQ